jgi:hypothetical protein
MDDLNPHPPSAAPMRRELRLSSAKALYFRKPGVVADKNEATEALPGTENP